MGDQRVESYKGYGVFDVGRGYLLISADNEWDYVPEPFCCVDSTKRRIDELTGV